MSTASTAGWVQPNYVNPQEQSWLPVFLAIAVGTATVIAWIRLGLRARKLVGGGLGWDDTFLFLGWIGLVALTIETAMLSHYGLGRHLWDIKPSNLMPLAKLLARGFAITFVLASGFIKISVLLFYRRLTAPIVRVVWAIYFALGFTTLVSAGLILYMAIVCSIQPVVTCQNNSVATLAAGIFSVVSDVYSIVLPIAVTWSLNLPFWKRVGLGALFSCGLVIVVVSSLRTYYLWHAAQVADAMPQVFRGIVASVMEVSLGIIVASLPTARLLWRKYLVPMVKNAAWPLTRSGPRSPPKSTTKTEALNQYGDEIPMHRCGDHRDKFPAEVTGSPDADHPSVVRRSSVRPESAEARSEGSWTRNGDAAPSPTSMSRTLQRDLPRSSQYA